jgi:putative transposase
MPLAGGVSMALRRIGLRAPAAFALIRQPMSDPRPEPEVPHRKRCRRFNLPGHAHYLTFSCFQRQPFLSRDRSRQWLAEAIGFARTKYQYELWAYVIMPEHAHVIVFPTVASYDISDFLNSVKQSVSKRALAFVKATAPDFLVRMRDEKPNGEVSHRFWQRGGGYDHNLWDRDRVWEKIDYLHNNPVKRELCARAEDWIWSSAGDYAGVRVGPLKLQLDSLKPRN